jgi:hypothetical protein
MGYWAAKNVVDCFDGKLTPGQCDQQGSARLVMRSLAPQAQ